MDVQIFLRVLCDKGTRPPFNYSERYIRNTFFIYIEEGNRLRGASLEQEAEAVSLWTWEDLFGQEPYPEPIWLARRGRRSSGSKSREDSDVPASASELKPEKKDDVPASTSELKSEKKRDVPASVPAPNNTSFMSRVEFLKTRMGVWHYLGIVGMGVLLSGLLGSSHVRNSVGQ
ncbi:hypothetical protein BGAL_0027g00160 [Botrytis galanthina]|uniref:Uncharacterized protein n=1 Tax=Botrytis galanthina TaxID=278940 RepID=A0A4S8RD18_9HELO|nr:hypothetical protein BGAL_0027g00160 [Botrytis galanthina]